MSMIINNIIKEPEKANENIKKTKTQSNKMINMLNGSSLSTEQKVHDKPNQQKSMFKKAIVNKNSIKDEKPIRMNRHMENHERSTFFLDAHENKEIKESDIVFGIVLKENELSKNAMEENSDQPK